MATWYRAHLDPQLPILMGARGPGYQCSETAHREPRAAVALPSPGEWWDGTVGSMPGDSELGMPTDDVEAGDDGD